MSCENRTLLLSDVLGKVAPPPEGTTTQSTCGHAVQTMGVTTKDQACLCLDVAWIRVPHKTQNWEKKRRQSAQGRQPRPYAWG